MNRIEVCFSPGEYHLYEQDFDLVVVLDVLRATSAICTAMEHGVGEIIPVATLEEARAYKAQGHIVACLLYTSPSPRDLSTSRMPSSA